MKYMTDLTDAEITKIQGFLDHPRTNWQLKNDLVEKLKRLENTAMEARKTISFLSGRQYRPRLLCHAANDLLKETSDLLDFLHKQAAKPLPEKPTPEKQKKKDAGRLGGLQKGINNNLRRKAGQTSAFATAYGGGFK